ncbi:MAG: hypothetical protein ACI89T_002180, partial [Cognaticolwellia sp.]
MSCCFVFPDITTGFCDIGKLRHVVQSRSGHPIILIIDNTVHINDESWLKLTPDFESIFTGAVDTAEQKNCGLS